MTVQFKDIRLRDLGRGAAPPTPVPEPNRDAIPSVPRRADCVRPGRAAQAAAPVDFAREVAPLLERSCLRCHTPGNAKGDIALATAAGLVRGGHVVPGKPEESLLLDLIATEDGAAGPTCRPRASRCRPRQVGPDPPLDRRGRRLAGGPDRLARAVEGRHRRGGRSARWPTRGRPTPMGLPAAWAAHPIDRFLGAALAEQGLPAFAARRPPAR